MREYQDSKTAAAIQKAIDIVAVILGVESDDFEKIEAALLKVDEIASEEMGGICDREELERSIREAVHDAIESTTFSRTQ